MKNETSFSFLPPLPDCCKKEIGSLTFIANKKDPMLNDGHGHVEFFDSYGRPPEENSIHILKWILETAKTWNFNEKQLQSNYSTVCGLYCLLYLCFKCLGGTMEKFTSLFDDSDFFLNDSFVYDMSLAIFSDCVKTNCTRNQSCCALDRAVCK